MTFSTPCPPLCLLSFTAPNTFGHRSTNSPFSPAFCIIFMFLFMFLSHRNVCIDTWRPPAKANDFQIQSYVWSTWCRFFERARILLSWRANDTYGIYISHFIGVKLSFHWKVRVGGGLIRISLNTWGHKEKMKSLDNWQQYGTSFQGIGCIFYASRKEWRFEWRESSTRSAPECTWTMGELSVTSSCRLSRGNHSQ